VKVELGSTIEALCFPVIALCVLNLARLGVDFTQPYRTVPRIGAAVVANVAWLVLLVIALVGDDLLQAAPSIEDPAEIARVVTIAERIFRVALLGLAAWTASLVATDARRLLRHR
jgi:hypothetical protein